MIEGECKECPGRRIIRLDTRLGRRLEVEGSLFDREERLEDLLVERDLDVTAQYGRDICIVGNNQSLSVAFSSDITAGQCSGLAVQAQRAHQRDREVDPCDQ